jgi:hypothetical protein
VSGRIIAAVAAVAAAGALSVSIGVAAAATINSPTVFTKFKLETGSSGATFSGKIGSAKSGCKKNRKVKLVRKKSGNEKTLGSDKTSGKGKFKIKLSGGNLGKGKYFAKVKKSSFKKSGDKIVCGKAKSGSVSVS